MVGTAAWASSIRSSCATHPAPIPARGYADYAGAASFGSHADHEVPEQACRCTGTAVAAARTDTPPVQRWQSYPVEMGHVYGVQRWILRG